MSVVHAPRGRLCFPKAAAALAASLLSVAVPAASLHAAQSGTGAKDEPPAADAASASVPKPISGTFVREDGKTRVTIEPPSAPAAPQPPEPAQPVRSDSQKSPELPPWEVLRLLTAEAKAIQLETSGAEGRRPHIPAVRRRLEKLEAIRSEAQAAMRDGPLSRRLEALRLAGSAHESFAEALEHLADPPELDREAADAWTSQKHLYGSAARTRALAYFRACAAMAAPRAKSPAKTRRSDAAAADARACTEALRHLDGKRGIPPLGSPLDRIPTAPAQIAALRSHELTVCVSEAAMRTRDAMPETVLIHLDIGASGEVSSASVEGAAGSEGLKACLADAVKLWFFPTIAGSALELPVHLRVAAE